MNPELLRLAWLEVTLQRLWMIPAVLVGIAVLIEYGPGDSPVLQPLAAAGFFLCAIVWGARQAANTIVEEQRGNTWDTQRMSALGAWPMTWGKLAGGTLMPWYAGLVCLAIAGGHALMTGEVLDTWRFAVLLVGAIALQGFALMLAIVGVHHRRGVASRLHPLLTALFLYLVLPDLATLVGSGVPLYPAADERAVFYGNSVAARPFALLLLGAIAAWMVVGAWRAMCLELQVRTRPLAWFGFIAFLATIAAGLDDGSAAPDRVRRWCSAFAIYATLLTYLAGFMFSHDPIRYRRMQRAFVARDWRRLLEETPLWLSSAIMALLAAVAATLLGSDPGIDNQRADNAGVSALALALLALRDIGLLLALSFRRLERGAIAATLLWLALLNRVLPTIFSFGGAGAIAALLRPPVFDSPFGAVLVAGMHVAIVAVLAVTAWRYAVSGTVRR